MNLSIPTQARLDDVSRHPTDEVSALVYKFLLQFRAEVEHLSYVPHRIYAGEVVNIDTEAAAIQEHARLIHMKLREMFPQFKYVHRFSYQCNDEGAPSMRSVNEEGFHEPRVNEPEPTPAEEFERDHIAQLAFTYLFENHLFVREDHSFEFLWEKLETPNVLKLSHPNETAH